MKKANFTNAIIEFDIMTESLYDGDIHAVSWAR